MTTLHVSKQFWKGGLLRIHKPIFTDGKIKAEHPGQGHAVSLCPRQGEMSAVLGPRAVLWLVNQALQFSKKRNVPVSRMRGVCLGTSETQEVKQGKISHKPREVWL